MLLRLHQLQLQFLHLKSSSSEEEFWLVEGVKIQDMKLNMKNNHGRILIQIRIRLQSQLQARLQILLHLHRNRLRNRTRLQIHLLIQNQSNSEDLHHEDVLNSEDFLRGIEDFEVDFEDLKNLRVDFWHLELLFLLEFHSLKIFVRIRISFSRLSGLV